MTVTIFVNGQKRGAVCKIVNNVLLSKDKIFDDTYCK